VFVISVYNTKNGINYLGNLTGQIRSALKGLCYEMNNLFEGLENQISTFCICADSFCCLVMEKNKR